MKKILSILPAVFLVGCAATPEKIVHIDSDPRGARVFYGVGANEEFAAKARQFIGITPFDWHYQPDGGGYFNAPGIVAYSTFVPPAIVFTADPASDATNLFQARQVYHRPSFGQGGDKVPEGIFFDLKRAPDAKK